MDDKLFGVVSTVVGLVAGWTLNETSSWIKTNRDNKRTLNQVLYTQLEIRDIIKKTNFPQLKSDITKLLKELIPGDQEGEIRDLVEPLFYGYLKNDLSDRFSNRLVALSESYKSQISELSKIDPYTTFYISNKEVLFDYLGLVDQYLSGIKKELHKVLLSDGQIDPPTNETIGETFQRISDHLTPMLYDEALDTIEDDIEDVAKKLGIVVRIKTIRFLKRTKSLEIDNFDMQKIKKLVNNYMASAVGNSVDIVNN